MPLKPAHPLHGLVAAAYTPFHADGSVNLEKFRELDHDGNGLLELWEVARQNK